MAIEKVTFREGEVVFNEGERTTDLYYLVSGKLDVFKGTMKIAEIDKPGSFIGEMSFFLGDKRTATVIAQSSVELKKASMGKITKFFATNPKKALEVARSLASRLNDTSAQVMELMKYKQIYEQLSDYSEKNKQLRKILDSFEQKHDESMEKMKVMLNEKSMTSKKIIQPFVKRTLESVENFMSAEVKKEDSFSFGDKRLQMDISSLVNIVGDCKGWYVLAFPKSTALKMASRGCGETYKDVNDDVVNFIKEFNNIIIGWIVSSIEEYSLTISTPSIIFGTRSIKNMVKNEPSLVVPFRTSLGTFYALLSLHLIR